MMCCGIVLYGMAKTIRPGRESDAAGDHADLSSQTGSESRSRRKSEVRIGSESRSRRKLEVETQVRRGLALSDVPWWMRVACNMVCVCVITLS